MSQPLITVHHGDTHTELAAHEGQTALGLIRDTGIPFSAPCGGKGTCGKCGLFVRDEAGLRFQLACQTIVTDGMTLEVGEEVPMLIEDAGLSLAHDFAVNMGVSGCGVAFDLGTTTLACRLFDLSDGSLLATATLVNPQAVFGADVISRIDASMAGQLDAMESAITRALAQLIERLCAEAEISREQIVRITLAGNTIMQHIASGLPPDTIGVSPFEPLSLFGEERQVARLDTPVYLAPCVAGYVGGDITCGLLACGVHTSERPQLLIDLGTNGEMAIGSKADIVSCATAAGPVFEGANIRFGMPALPGAINAARELDGILEIETIGNKTPVGICGTGLIDLIAILLRRGIIENTGRLLSAEKAANIPDLPTTLLNRLGTEGGFSVFYLTEDRSVYLTQVDIRNVQLAKSAIFSGVLVLLEDLGLSTSDLDALFIAGGFGRRLDLTNAATVGLFPFELLDRAQAVGNTSIEGASAALISTQAREELSELTRQCRYVELSTSTSFNRFFTEYMIFEP
ncbi:MAG: ASKHA domain-containing protein [Coriobacteriales bacterium]|jgi:uncharacterized 2Fe-2S/4Fe-4S cluster protein (DUF4445 family)|nr:ASKHA domain-containing protein [Coriobacteriales bacterium]